jgi:membrane protein implicated in regulation of membrane protease activity
MEDLRPEGLVKVGGVYWKAACAGCEVSTGGGVESLNIRNGRAYVRPCQWEI